MKHTPGPWKYREQAVPSYGYYIETGTQTRSEHDKFIGQVGGGIMPMEIIEANAKLIASAPEMLKALMEISEGKGRFDLDPKQHLINCLEDMVQLAKETIKKATE